MPVATLPTFPSDFFAGDTVRVTFNPGDYPAPGWDLSVFFTGPQNFEAPAVDDGAGHLVTLAGADTATKTPGVYSWAAVVTDGTDRQTISAGSVWIKPNPATGALSYAARCLVLIEAHIEGRLPQGLSGHNIAGNQISKITIADAEKLRDKYRAEVAAEQRAALEAEGGDPSVLQIEFTRR